MQFMESSGSLAATPFGVAGGDAQTYGAAPQKETD